METAFLDMYEAELRFLREMGAEFAEGYPKIASRLKLDSAEVADPYVERLLEGFAFLTARVQLKMAAQFPFLTQSLRSLLHPNLTSVTPSCAVLELSPRMQERALVDGYSRPRGTPIVAQGTASGRSTTSPPRPTSCCARSPWRRRSMYRSPMRWASCCPSTRHCAPPCAFAFASPRSPRSRP